VADEDRKPEEPSSLPGRIRRSLQLSPGRLRRLDGWSEIAALVLLIALILRQGYQLPVLAHAPVALGVGILLLLLVAARLGLEALATVRPALFFKLHAPDLAVFALLLLPRIGIRTAAFLLALRVLFRAGSRLLTSPAGRTWVVGVQRHPARIIAFTFLGLIAGGTLFLTFPGASTTPGSAPPLTALFTSTSAVCVTGLIVVDTPSYWTPFGQWVILVLMQVGGLGIMTLSASAALALGRALGAGSRGFLEEILEETAKRDITRLLQFIVAFTFATEAVGTAILGLYWSRVMPASEAWFNAVFHAVSAFCNAGFSTFSTSLERWVGDPVVNVVIALLIIVGGIGFTVAASLWGLFRRPLHPVLWWRHERTHTRLVLTTTAVLVVAGAMAFFYFDYDSSLSGLPMGQKLLSAFFQSVTARTAGFDTVSMSAVAPVTATVLMVLMFIGGSPGGTAGGIKTTTIAILALTFRSLSRGRRDVEVFSRRVPDETLLKAIAVTLLGGALLAVCFMLLLVIQPGMNYLDLMFEAVSAFGTVGLSRGVTAALTPPGRLIIILLMFVGRTGPLTLAFAVGKSATRTYYRYPESRILVG
jgi:trk system potassium uptake protein TrkH